MSALAIVAIVLASVSVHLAIGYAAGRRAAPIVYRRHRLQYEYLARASLHFGEGSAAMALGVCTLLGPLGWAYPLAFSATTDLVPELRTARAAAVEKAHREEIAAMQKQIDTAHRALGIAPLDYGKEVM